MRYQDYITGEIYEFSPIQNVDELIKTNRNIPKTLTPNVQEKPNDEFVWFNKKWVHKKEVPKDYFEPISEIPVYDPGWIIFPFKPLTLLADNENIFKVSLDEINSNIYDTRILSQFSGILEKDDSTGLSILFTVDSSIMIPINDTYKTKEKALEKFNEIIGFLFVSGLLIKPINLNDILVGCIAEDGKSSFCFIPSENTDVRNKTLTIDKRINILYPHFIHKNDFIDKYEKGQKIVKSMNFSPFFLGIGFFYLLEGKVAEALNNLWIIVEQLTDKIYQQKITLQNHKNLKNIVNNRLNIKDKQKIMFKLNIIDNRIHSVLSLNRNARNKLLHEGKIPKKKDVFKLWDVILFLLEISTGENLENVKTSSSNVLKSINDIAVIAKNRRISFDNWVNITKSLHRK